jgi:hypothetical protein
MVQQNSLADRPLKRGCDSVATIGVDALEEEFVSDLYFIGLIAEDTKALIRPVQWVANNLAAEGQEEFPTAQTANMLGSPHFSGRGLEFGGAQPNSILQVLVEPAYFLLGTFALGDITNGSKTGWRDAAPSTQTARWYGYTSAARGMVDWGKETPMAENSTVPVQKVICGGSIVVLGAPCAGVGICGWFTADPPRNSRPRQAVAA